MHRNTLQHLLIDGLLRFAEQLQTNKTFCPPQHSSAFTNKELVCTSRPWTIYYILKSDTAAGDCISISRLCRGRVHANLHCRRRGEGD